MLLYIIHDVVIVLVRNALGRCKKACRGEGRIGKWEEFHLFGGLVRGEVGRKGGRGQRRNLNVWGGEENCPQKVSLVMAFMQYELLIGMYSRYGIYSVVPVKLVFSVPLFRHVLYPMEKLSD